MPNPNFSAAARALSAAAGTSILGKVSLALANVLASGDDANATGSTEQTATHADQSSSTNQPSERKHIMSPTIFEAAKRLLGDAYNRETGEFDIKKMQERAFKDRGKTNILLMGATGSGKSSLINAIFGDNVVKAGSGAPVTQHIEKIAIKEKGLILWDTKGIEAGDYEGTMRQLKGEIEKAFEPSKGQDEFPHIALLCIKESSSRIEDREHALLEITKKHGIPALVVFTDMRGDEGEEFVKKAQAIFAEKHGTYVKGYARVNSIPYKIGKATIDVDGITELVE